MKIDWQRKLTSRKFWVSVAGFIAGFVVIFGGSQEAADKISGVILSAASVVGYMIGEGLTDCANLRDPENSDESFDKNSENN